MKQAIRINFDKRLWSAGILILSFLALSFNLSSQCTADPTIQVDTESVTFDPFGVNRCWIRIPIRVLNAGPCDMSGFTMIFSVTSPEGTENFVHIVAGPITAGNSVLDQVNFPSTLFFDNIDGDCFTSSDVTIDYMISNLDPPTSMTESIACPFGDGLVIVCTNDNSVICDDRFCEPFPCSTEVGVAVNESFMSIVDEAGNTCSLNIPYALTSSGTCDVGIFNIDIVVTTPDGVETISQSVSGLAAGTNTNGNVNVSSAILESNVNNACFDLSDISVVSSISSTVPPEAITTTIPCPDGKGTLEVCANNNFIVCDQSSCVPYTCENIFGFNVDNSGLSISATGTGICSLVIPYTGVNMGDCDVSGFSLNITISTPVGIQVFTDTYAGPLAAGASFNQSFTVTHPVLSPNASNCFDLADIDITIIESSTNGPQPITTTIACPDGLGTIEVCTNNFDITCDASNCEFIIPIDLIGLEGNKENTNVNLFWQTASEVNNDYFLIEHSADGTMFTTIGMVQGQGNSSEINDYKYLHIDPVAGSNYYRLAMVDNNGHIDFSNTIHISYSSSIREIFISPNPASDQLTVHGLNTFEEQVDIAIFSANGSLIKRDAMNTEMSYDFVNISALESGIYFIHISDGRNKEVHKFVKI